MRHFFFVKNAFILLCSLCYPPALFSSTFLGSFDFLSAVVISVYVRCSFFLHAATITYIAFAITPAPNLCLTDSFQLLLSFFDFTIEVPTKCLINLRKIVQKPRIYHPHSPDVQTAAIQPLDLGYWYTSEQQLDQPPIPILRIKSSLF